MNTGCTSFKASFDFGHIEDLAFNRAAFTNLLSPFIILTERETKFNIVVVLMKGRLLVDLHRQMTFEENFLSLYFGKRVDRVSVIDQSDCGARQPLNFPQTCDQNGGSWQGRVSADRRKCESDSGSCDIKIVIVLVAAEGKFAKNMLLPTPFLTVGTMFVGMCGTL